MNNKQYKNARQEQINRIKNQVTKELAVFTPSDALIQLVIKMMIRGSDSAFEDGFFSAVYMTEVDRRTHFHVDHSNISLRQARKVAEQGLDYEVDVIQVNVVREEQKH